MAEKLTDEQLRELIEGVATPVKETVETPSAYYKWHDARTSLSAAAPDLAQEVLELRAETNALSKEILSRRAEVLVLREDVRCGSAAFVAQEVEIVRLSAENERLIRVGRTLRAHVRHGYECNEEACTCGLSNAMQGIVKQLEALRAE